jgi:hypothetical protein
MSGIVHQNIDMAAKSSGRLSHHIDYLFAIGRIQLKRDCVPAHFFQGSRCLLSLGSVRKIGQGNIRAAARKRKGDSPPDAYISACDKGRSAGKLQVHIRFLIFVNIGMPV